jgi:radical SAM superfamily enzyme YgiQ (UPF0313 family)
MTNALFVYPPFLERTFWSFTKSLEIIGKKANLPPYGLITVAAMMPEDWQIKLVDENVTKLKDKDIKAADMVFASAMIAQRDSLDTLIARCKKLGKQVVVGGPLISTGYQDIKGADHYFIGEAEQTMPAFLADLKAGKAKKAYAHVTEQPKADMILAHFKNDASLIVGQRPVLGSTPLPRFDLLDLKKYASMAIQYSRGCPTQCEFCDIWVQSGIVPRLKPADRLVAEVDALHKLGYKGSIFIVDDNFIGNRRRVKEELLPSIINWQKAHDTPFSFYTEATVLMADDDQLLKQMRDAGFDMVFCGIETPSEASLQEAGKRINIVKNDDSKSLLNRVRRIQEAGIEVSSGFIIGFDNDPADIDELMIDFIQRANIPLAMVGLLTALPETKLYDRLLREGRIKAASIGNNTHTFDVNFEPKIPVDKLLATYGHVLNAIYDPKLKNYYARVDRAMDIIGERPKVGRGVDLEGVMILANAINHMALTSYGPSTLSFLFKRLMKNPRTFPKAVEYAVKGHHQADITSTAIQVHNTTSYLQQTQAKLSEHVHNLQAKYHQTMESAHVSYGLKRQQFKEAYALKQDALRQARKRLARMNEDARIKMKARYDKFVTDVQELYRPLEMKGHS